MWRFSLTFAVALASAEAVTAQNIDRDKLRKAICLPNVSLSLGVQFTANVDYGDSDLNGKRIDFARKVADLEKRLDGSVRDGETYLRLVPCLARLGQHDRARDARRKAEAVLRPSLEKEGPGQGHLLALYAEALAPSDSADLARAEACARRAVKLAPADWRCWAALGEQCGNRALGAIYGEFEKVPPLDLDRLQKDLAGPAPPPHRVKAARGWLREARWCYDEAQRVSPHDPEALSACFAFSLLEVPLKRGLAGWSGETAHATQDRRSPLIRDYVALAEACPQSPHRQAMAVACLRIFAGEPTASPLSPKEEKIVRECLARLQALAKSPDREVAALSNQVLAELVLVQGDGDAAVRYARRAVALSAEADAYELLASLLLAGHQYPEGIEMARAWRKQRPTSQNGFVLAKAHVNIGQLQEAEQVFRDALRPAPDNLPCALGLAAVLMMRGNDAEAGALLVQARARVGPSTSEDLRSYLAFLDAVHRGLSGDTVGSGTALMRLLQQPSGREARQALEAFPAGAVPSPGSVGPPVRPAS